MNNAEAIFIKAVSVFSAIVESVGLYHLFRAIKKNSATVLMYHGITASNNQVENFDQKHIRKEKFEKQLLYMKKHYTVISLEEFALWKDRKKTFPKPPMLLTFDDGYKNCFTQLFPILKKYKVPATIFLPTVYIGTKEPAWYDAVSWCIAKTKRQEIIILGKKYLLANEKQKIGALVELKKLLTQNQEQRKELINTVVEQTACNPKECTDEDLLFMAWEDCREMQKYNVTFGSHSVNHHVMTVLDEEQIKKEARDSKKDIEKKLRRECTLFSYPFGNNNHNIREILRKENYQFAWTTMYGTNTTKTERFQLQRIGLNNLYDINIFKLTLVVNFPVFHHWLRVLYQKILY